MKVKEGGFCQANPQQFLLRYTKITIIVNDSVLKGGVKNGRASEIEIDFTHAREP